MVKRSTTVQRGAQEREGRSERMPVLPITNVPTDLTIDSRDETVWSVQLPKAVSVKL
jgi:hypothetical protein